MKNHICENLIAFNFTSKTIQSCETTDHIDTAREMVHSYGRLHATNPKTAFRHKRLLEQLKIKLTSINPWS